MGLPALPLLLCAWTHTVGTWGRAQALELASSLELYFVKKKKNFFLIEV